MTEFKASNGYTILARENATVDWWSADEVHRGIIQVFTHSQVWDALREFFQHERDEALGRWRHGEVVVYPIDRDSDHPMVHEPTGERAWFGPGWTFERDQVYTERFAAAERAYIEAHPERKPWEDATYKDVWVWTTADNTQEALGWVAGDGTWDIITPKGDGIKAAERPVSALVEAGFEKFRGEVSGVKRIPEDAS